jgi:hypothetical protein
MTSRAHSSSFFSFPCRRDSPRIRFSWGDFTVHHSSNTPLRVRPREMSGAFLPRQRWGFFFKGGYFRVTTPREENVDTKIYPRDWMSVSRTTIARRPSSPRGTSARSSARPTAPLRMSDRPTATPRRRAIGPGVTGETSGGRARGRAGASPRASRPPFLDALARTSWCVRSDRRGARGSGSGSVPNVDARVSRRRVRGARGGDDGGERCGE